MRGTKVSRSFSATTFCLGGRVLISETIVGVAMGSLFGALGFLRFLLELAGSEGSCRRFSPSGDGGLVCYRMSEGSTFLGNPRHTFISAFTVWPSAAVSVGAATGAETAGLGASDCVAAGLVAAVCEG